MAETRATRPIGAGATGQLEPDTLDPITSTPARVEGLLAAGLEMEELALALDVTPTTIRNWLRGAATPRRGAVRTIDDLRQVAVILIEGGMDGVEMAQWLRSRQGRAMDDERPLDLIAQDPIRVLAAAHGSALEREERDQLKAGLHLVPEG